MHAPHASSLPFIIGGHHVTVIPEMSTVMSLVLIIVSLVVVASVSLTKPRGDVAAVTSAGLTGD